VKKNKKSIRSNVVWTSNNLQKYLLLCSAKESQSGLEQHEGE